MAYQSLVLAAVLSAGQVPADPQFVPFERPGQLSCSNGDVTVAFSMNNGRAWITHMQTSDSVISNALQSVESWRALTIDLDGKRLVIDNGSPIRLMIYLSDPNPHKGVLFADTPHSVQCDVALQ